MLGIEAATPTGDTWEGLHSWWTNDHPQTTFGTAVFGACR